MSTSDSNLPKAPEPAAADPSIAASERWRTPLGAALAAIREEIVASGVPLLDWQDLEREIADRRGGVSACPDEPMVCDAGGDQDSRPEDDWPEAL